MGLPCLPILENNLPSGDTTFHLRVQVTLYLEEKKKKKKKKEKEKSNTS